jgi:hypothetical protein
VIDYETILRQILAKERALTPPSLVFRPRIHPFERSPIMLRPRKARNTCSSTNITVHKDLQSPLGLSDEALDIETLSKPRTRTAQTRNKLSYAVNTSKASGRDVHRRQYCTHACLLGLTRRSPLDKACPNVSAHRALRVGNHHGLNWKILAQLMLYQLA